MATGNDEDYSEVFCVRGTQDGCYIFSGLRSNTLTQGENHGTMLMKMNDDGDFLWHYLWPHSAGQNGYACAEASDGNYYLAGWSPSGSVETCTRIVKTDPDGGEILNLLYEYRYTMVPQAIAPTDDGGLMVLCNAKTEMFDFHSHPYLMRLDADGDTLWTRLYNDSLWSYADDLIGTSDGGWAFAGYFTGAALTTVTQMYLVKTDSDGGYNPGGPVIRGVHQNGVSVPFAVPYDGGRAILLSAPAAPARLRIIDSRGRVLYQAGVVRGSTRVSLERLPAGVYCVSLAGDAGTWNGRVAVR